MLKLLLFFGILLLSNSLANGKSRVGEGHRTGGVLPDPWSSEKPPFIAVPHPLAPTSFWGNFTDPLPTNSWWGNLILADGTMPVVPQPFMVTAQPNGLFIGYPTPSLLPGDQHVIETMTQDGSLLCVENLQARTVVAWDELSVTMQWSSSDEKNYLSSPLVVGSPWITMEYSGLTPQFTTVHAILSINNETSQTITGNKFSIYMNSGQTWLLYAMEEITLTWSGQNLTATAPYSSALRLTILNQGTSEEVLDNAADVYPTGGNVSLGFNGDVGTITYSYFTEGGDASNLLMLAVAHHQATLVDPKYETNLNYHCIKGNMTGVYGATWVMQEPLTNITWFSEEIDQSRVDEINAALANDTTNPNITATDPYYFGKEVAKYARLALIAEQLGDNATAWAMREFVIQNLTPWYTGTNNDSLRYDLSYGGCCTINGLENSGADFGMGYYNDHHFHFGYWLYATAVVLKDMQNPVVSSWWNKIQQNCYSILRDIANPSSADPYFPVTRHKDWWMGHSWASGLFVFADSKNQESTSESVNAYYGIYLLGLALGDNTMRDFGRLTLAMEIRGAQTYWHMSTNQVQIYPAAFEVNKVVGILWGDKVDYATWFGMNVEFIHCIQMMPFTPITQQLLPKDWVEQEYPVVATSLNRTDDPISPEWAGYVYMDHAIIDAEAAWNEAVTLDAFDNGNSRTNTLYWVATRPQ